MILVILFIAIVLFVGGLVLQSISGFDDLLDILGFGMSFVGGIIGVIAGIATVVLLCECTSGWVIDSKIAMYQEENAKIEEQIATVVKEYQDYETDIFTSVGSNESAITLVSLYPELKSDELVSSQISVYVENNQKIKELKESKINASVYRWWLYFGK